MHPCTKLASGTEALVARGRTLLAEGDLAMACHVADWAVSAAPKDRGALEFKRDAFQRRLQAEEAGIAGGIFQSAVNEVSRALGDLGVRS